MNKSSLRPIVRGAYDLQTLRIQMGGRITANFRAKLGILPSTKTDEAEADAKKILKWLKEEYRLVTDGMATFPRAFKENGESLISNMAELVLVDQYFRFEREEIKSFNQLKKVLKDYPIYTQFLEGIYGIGHTMAGVIISEIDIHKAKYASSIWAYAGLDVVNGKGRSRKQEHLVEVEYTDRDGNKQMKKGITFNPFLKTKLIGVLGSSFIKQSAEKCPYRLIYDNYKNRLRNHPDHKDKSKGHTHNMAVRYMVKMFLVDLYKVWREIEGLEVYPPYSEAKLGLRHQYREAIIPKTTKKIKRISKKETTTLSK